MNISKLGFIAVVLFSLSNAVSADSEGYIGEITLFASTFEPRNHMYCDGRLLSISDYQALFSLLGTKYGGNGRTTFALPNFSEAEKSLQGARYIIQVEGVYPSRS